MASLAHRGIVSSSISNPSPGVFPVSRNAVMLAEGTKSTGGLGNSSYAS